MIDLFCDVCGDAIEDDDPHYYHEPDCPRFFDDTSNYPCRCDFLVAHGQCCPQCAAPVETQAWYRAGELASKAQGAIDRAATEPMTAWQHGVIAALGYLADAIDVLAGTEATETECDDNDEVWNRIQEMRGPPMDRQA